MVTLALSAYDLSTTGFSPAANFIRKETAEAKAKLRDSFSLGAKLRAAHEQLLTIFGECQKSGWDGYGAEAVSPETYRNACRFLESLPPGIPIPTIGVEADGHLTFEWYRNPSRVLSVSISPEADLHYATLLGGNSRISGTEPFLGDMPDDILRIIRRLFPA